MDKFAKRLLYVATFTAPFYPIIPTSISFYEVFLALSLLALLASRSKIELPDGTILVALIMILVGYSIGSVKANDPLEAAKFPIQFSIIILQFFLLYNLVDGKNDIYKHAVALSFSLVVICVFSVLQILALDVHVFDFRVEGFYGNPNQFANHILLLMTICIGTVVVNLRYKNDHCRTLNLIFAISIAISVVLLVLSQSRRGILFLIFVAGILLITDFGTINNYLNIIKKGVVVVITGACISAGLFVLELLPSNLLDRINPTTSAGSIQYRIIPLIVAFRYSRENPLVGSGYNNFVLIMGNYANSDAELLYLAQPHNWFIMPLVEGGIIAFIGVIILFSMLITRGIETWRRGIQGTEVIGFVFFVGALGYITAQQFGIFELLRFPWLFIWLGFIFCQVHKRENHS